MKSQRHTKPHFVFLFLLLLSSLGSMAQEFTLRGKVTDAANGEPLPGVSILIQGTMTGTTTNPDGEYSLNVKNGDVLVFSFIGFKPQYVTVTGQQTLNIRLEEEQKELQEVVVIGYGQVRKNDATGSVVSINANDFNPGVMSSPQDLLIGKTPGVQITTGGGAPGDGATIRIRGGSSMKASNDPLIVVDGVPLDNTGINGMRNPLNAINPADIETFTVLKDASSTAIYGARASNGVILITTKKGKKGQPFRVNYSGQFSVGWREGEIDVLSADEFRETIRRQFAGNTDIIDNLGNADTDWQDEIYRVAVSHDHNIDFSGSKFNTPFRLSLGHTNQQGILKTTNLKRYTGALNLNPTFFDDFLKINLQAKGMYIKNNFGNTASIGEAVAFDPTRPVKDGNERYGGYFTWTQATTGNPNIIAPINPVAHLKLHSDKSDVKRFIGNIQFDYRLHFFPDLRANLNLAYDYSKSDGKIIEPESASWTYDEKYGSGYHKKYSEKKHNELLEFYLNYNKNITSIASVIDVVAGYSWQHFKRSTRDYATNTSGTYIREDKTGASENYLLSFFGRLNYTFKDKYLFTLTVRGDGSSRFAKDQRWGTFPSLALAWRIDQEEFMQQFSKLSTLKLRLGYGITGQQDIVGNDYPYLPNYTISNDKAQYQFGNNFIYTLRPNGYDAKIKWEETTTWNAGIDFGFFNNRLNGSFDYYYRKTKDLINEIPVAAGSNLTNKLVTNVGDLSNEGFELNLNAVAVNTEEWNWEINVNVSYNKNKIIKLIRNKDPNYVGVLTGGISGGTGSTIQIHSEGHPSNAFYVYRQVYDKDGKPIEGVYADLNHDGIINQLDLYRYKSPAPKCLAGFSSYLTYKNWDLTIAGRFSFGNYVYNNVESNQALYSRLYNNTGFYSNLPSSIGKTRFEEAQYFSDYYVRNASFMKLDNITLGYNFKKLWNNRLDLRVYALMQNVFTVTRYKGLDPEIFNGIDNNLYPRPQTVLLGVNIGF